MKDLLKSIVISIGMALAIFSFVGIVFDVMGGGVYTLENYRYTKMVIASVIVGLGFGVPTLVYKSDRIPTPVKVLVHMGIGCIIYTIVAFSVGWLGGASSVIQGILIACIQLAVAFVIWFCFMRYYRKEAKEMNDKISSMK
jgi:cellobiose-specific phosphotransferase system component IIC